VFAIIKRGATGMHGHCGHGHGALWPLTEFLSLHVNCVANGRSNFPAIFY